MGAISFGEVHQYDIRILLHAVKHDAFAI